jgi:NHL repeat
VQLWQLELWQLELKLVEIKSLNRGTVNTFIKYRTALNCERADNVGAVGSRNAFTSLETASTPVMAVQPLEKTLSSSQRLGGTEQNGFLGTWARRVSGSERRYSPPARADPRGGDAHCITTVAGTGMPDYTDLGDCGPSGDGGPAIDAQLSFPADVAADSAGNIYIADWGNNRIRKVSPDGIITTIAGNGIQGYSGDSGLASSASFWGPTALAVDGGVNIYVADPGNNASCAGKR